MTTPTHWCPVPHLTLRPLEPRRLRDHLTELLKHMPEDDA